MRAILPRPMDSTTPPVAVLGAGPAGLTAGYLLARRGVPVVVFEADDQVGGIARTVERDGYRFDLFFRSYTEKVWGVSTSELRAEWAAQRIRNLSFAAAARAALVGDGGRRVTSLIEEFHYPRLGPGQMWEAMAAEIVAAGGELRLATPVTRIDLDAG